jgi:RNA polymerase sigma factor (sigma-70 family)
VREALEQRFRMSHGRLMAALTRRFGVERFALIENAVQDAYVRALEHWPLDGTPEQPERWLVRVAHNAIIDALRRDARVESLDDTDRNDPPASDSDVDGDLNADLNSDNELRLMFLCCDPVLTRAAQVALVLNVMFGLMARQIAAAFISDERTVAQRIVRAKQRLRDEGVRFDMPKGIELPPRLDAILDVLYVVFSEGYNPTEHDAGPLDMELCDDALRLTRLLTEHQRTAAPSTFALRALLCLHASRIPARLGDDGSLLLMQEQDRATWDPTLIKEAFTSLDRAGRGHDLSRFHLEAAIAACHAIAPTYATTDWPRIVSLYDLLKQRAPSLIVDVNRALAIAMQSGARTGLDELDAIPERDVLSRYPYALAAYADLHTSLGNLQEARTYLDRALDHQSSPAQQALLKRKRTALER